VRTQIIEVTNGPRNWGKFLVGQFDDEWTHPSAIGGRDSLLAERGWTHEHVLVLDLQTGEGALFRLGGYAKADLDKHRVWVCPMFEPFLEWLYANWRPNEELPPVVDLPDAEFQWAGYRRPGPEAS
jgi:hypothetical protein